ncbi:hypothetical protein [Solilutibacter silvestris]|uniref:hypothetical protein n=1 Tax=Solilutibacter silvestris TaxID=1645665 RepID=UPI003D326DF9
MFDFFLILIILVLASALWLVLIRHFDLNEYVTDLLQRIKDLEDSVKVKLKG